MYAIRSYYAKIGAFVQEMETSANFLFETFEEVKEFSAGTACPSYNFV